MTTLQAPAPSVRPLPITLAVILTALTVIANFAGFALPTGGVDVPLFVVLSSVILGVAGVPAAIGLWLLRRWGWILAVVVAVLNLLAALPGIPMGPTAAIKIFSAVFAVVSIAILILVLRREVRRVYR